MGEREPRYNAEYDLEDPPIRRKSRNRKPLPDSPKSNCKCSLFLLGLLLIVMVGGALAVAHFGFDAFASGENAQPSPLASIDIVFTLQGSDLSVEYFTPELKDKLKRETADIMGIEQSSIEVIISTMRRRRLTEVVVCILRIRPESAAAATNLKKKTADL